MRKREIIVTEKSTKKYAPDNKFIQVHEEGCYMRDYVIGMDGSIVRTYVMHVIDKGKIKRF
ncbi:hypothetical protein SAMN02910358_01126 [Lachnospiraceae bacterium XBB1006]|nr:hypothetical protein SAMN02910358_01126 [Lachnospiraceae bacterium XBB1006]